MFDLAGFVPVLRSDRGAAFLSEVVAQINNLVHTDHCLGSAYHPQSQGFVEARHQKINRLLASYCGKHPERWARWLPLAQWVMRATPLASRGSRSPFEIITGMLPQGPIDDVVRRLEPGKVLDPESYVRNLVDSLSSIHETIANELKATHDEGLHEKQMEEQGVALGVGDIVVLKVPPQMLAQEVGAAGGVSTRLLPRYRPTLYRIRKMVSPQDVILADPDTGSTQLGFQQPVHISRLHRFDLAELDTPIEEGPLTIEVLRGTSWKRGLVQRQSATGQVLVTYPDEEAEWLDLGSEEYRWTYSVDAPPKRRLRTKTRD